MTEWIQKEMMVAMNKVREQTPLVPSITNTVTINLVANAQLAVGGSAAMVYLPDEGESLAKLGQSFYINVGTMFPIYQESLPRTVQALVANQTPWVLDPVAVGLGELRTSLLASFKQGKPNIIRGNASEIIALAGLWGLSGGAKDSQVKGVDASEPVEQAIPAAISLARWTNGAVAVSGERDIITDGHKLAFSSGGSSFYEKITGAGCSLGGVCAVYQAVTTPFIAALTASTLYNVAGKLAEQQATGPASFQQHFLDQLYQLSPSQVASHPFELKEVSE
ncbi:hydroxyethylthiazole kinase [Vagococcus humatus]|uniref:Hydroxyethylthiazole kinase n=1 Tax=Vagococcus humatus TaxID=1889241 RepID=A0A429Z6Q4_9ENTE|nr:hydroxyethylthiazole kinase [Vagococcus humatus]RST89366.1 hydroxyethylthiazole kinase [Vagococcus humatus]